MLNVNFTFDYEVFFRKNIGTYEEILFNPTNQIMNILDEFDVRGTFFVDTLSYFAMVKAGHIEYANNFKRQVIDMLKRGHNPQLHIHAHWLNSVYDKETGTWSNDYKKYRLQDYNDEEIENALLQGIEFLNKCAKEANVEYQCNTFRAGGLILQPESKLIELLLKCGIKYDSTIAPNAVSTNEFAEYNYKNTPKVLNWKFDSKNGCCKSSFEEKSLYEVPVATVRNNPFRYAISFCRIRIVNKNPLGIGFIRPKTKTNFFSVIKRRLFGYSWVSLDTRNASIILSDLKTIYGKYKCKYFDSTVSLIGHPKMFTEQNYINLRTLILKIKKNKIISCVLKGGNR